MKRIKLFQAISIGLISAVLVVAPAISVSAIDPVVVDAAQTKRMENLVQRADTEINRRLVALNNLTSKVSSLKKVSDGQKAAFISEIQSNVTDLTTLKTRIDGDTDLETLKTDVQSIVDNYRIFALYIPKIHLLAGADVASEIAGSLDSLTIKLQNKIATDKDAGKDVTALQASLTDMQNKISDASSQVANLTDSVIQLVPSGYPGNSVNLSSARDMLKTARSDIQAARQDAQLIVTGLKAFQTTKSTNG